MVHIKMNSITQSKQFYDVFSCIYMMNMFKPCISQEDVFLLTKEVWEMDNEKIKAKLKSVFG